MRIAVVCISLASAAMAQPGIVRIGAEIIAHDRSVFITNPEGFIEALSAVDGKPLWRSAKRARLLDLDGGTKPAGLVSCQSAASKTPAICIAYFGSAKGELLKQSSALPLPEFAPQPAQLEELIVWQGAGYEYGSDENKLSIIPVGAGGGSTLLNWVTHWQYAGGAAPPKEMATSRSAAGSFRVNPKTAAVAATSSADTGKKGSAQQQQTSPDTPMRYESASLACEIQPGESARVSMMKTRESLWIACTTKPAQVKWKRELAPRFRFRSIPRP
jgi:hypothetical protein